jgi:hypothetical protein
VQSFRFQERAQLTLDALNQVAHYLANIPGRKNLIWFSGSFPINVMPGPTVNNGFASMASSEEEFRETTDLLTRARVAIYPVDARGLMNSNTFSATASGTKYGRSPTAVGTDEVKFNQQMAADDETMLQAAQDTGGRAFVNTNGLSDAVIEAIDDGSNYYTLTFSPANKSPDGRYHKIEVAAPNKSYRLSYRRGYFADDPNAATKVAADKGGSPDDPASKSLISRTMVRGAPVPTEIQFTVRVRPESAGTESTVAPANRLNADSALARPPFTRYAVDFAINQRDLSFKQDADGFHDVIQFVTFVYDQAGNLINRTGSIMQQQRSKYFDTSAHDTWFGSESGRYDHEAGPDKPRRTGSIRSNGRDYGHDLIGYRWDANRRHHRIHRRELLLGRQGGWKHHDHQRQWAPGRFPHNCGNVHRRYHLCTLQHDADDRCCQGEHDDNTHCRSITWSGVPVSCERYAWH